jgi:hypothetical protein
MACHGTPSPVRSRLPARSLAGPLPPVRLLVSLRSGFSIQSFCGCFISGQCTQLQEWSVIHNARVRTRSFRTPACQRLILRLVLLFTAASTALLDCCRHVVYMKHYHQRDISRSHVSLSKNHCRINNPPNTLPCCYCNPHRFVEACPTSPHTGTTRLFLFF